MNPVVGLGRRLSQAVAPTAVGAVVLVLVACGGTSPSGTGGGPTAAAGATPGATSGAPATQIVSLTPAPAGSGAITDPCKLFSADEVTPVIGAAATKIGDPSQKTLDIYVGPLTGCGYSAGQATYLSAGIVPPGGGQGLCQPSPCPSYDAIKSGQPHPTTAIPGVGDDAFASDQGGTGTGPFLVGAKKGDTAVYLYAIGPVTSATLDAMRTLLAAAVSRI